MPKHLRKKTDAKIAIRDHRQMVKALRVSEKKFRSFFEHVIGGAFQSTPDGKLLLVNDSFVRLLGYRSKADLMSKNAVDLYADPQDRVKWNSQLISKGRLQNAELILKRKDGQIITVLENARTLHDEKGNVLYYEGTLTDITERKQIDLAKTEFVFLASHQLRTPLSAINWYTEVLLNDSQGTTNTKQTDYLEKIYASNQRMINLINDFLNVSQIELGIIIIKPQTVDLVEKSRSALEELKSQFSAKEIEIREKYQGQPRIQSDPKIITVILQNLLSNAFKYTPPKGQISITITKQKTGVAILIKDSGYGIPHDQHHQVFTKFFRADNIKERSVAGTGLGLYIVKSMLTRIGGKIKFKSAEKRGTAFYIHLPFRIA
ncbi:MAG: hypothetical protein A2240_00770 [Candidatus Jacksonbacteria bacterium RIFOXYA2_FULL_43_12]|nr:MAG: hypothetical protein A2240_00770 [Candidatus Jacksonbacteria bacterium RIFOXYA2_FULL_43_12]